MNFCPKCGTKLNESANKCPGCGHQFAEPEKQSDPVIQETQPKQPDPQETSISQMQSEPDEKSIPQEQPPVAATVEKPFNGKKSRTLLFAIIGALVALTVAYFSMNSYYSDSSRVVGQFRNAVTANDAKALKNVLSCTDSRLKIDEENSKVLLQYFKDNPSSLNELLSNLDKESAAMKSSGFSLLKESSSDMLTLKKSGSNLLIFPRYTIDVMPCFINVSTEVKDVQVSLNDKEVCKSDSENFKKEIGPFMPGKYALTASFKSDLVTSSEKKEVDLFKEPKASVKLLSDLRYVSITSDVKSAQVFANGKDAKLTVDKAGKFGPVDKNTVLYAVSKNGSDTLKSTEVMVRNSSEVNLSFQEAKAMKEDFKDNLYWFMNSYGSYFADAVNQDNFLLIEPFLEPGSKIFDMQKKAVTAIHQQGIYERCLKFDVTDYKYDEGTKEGTLTTSEAYDLTSSKGETSTKTFAFTYKFKFNPSLHAFTLTELIEK